MSRRIMFTLQVLRYTEGERDIRGNRKVTYVPAEPIGVYAFYPTLSTESNEPGRRAVVTGRTALAPIEAKDKIDEHDRVIGPDGKLYNVKGQPGPWEGNPHAVTPRNESLQIELERNTG